MIARPRKKYRRWLKELVGWLILALAVVGALAGILVGWVLMVVMAMLPYIVLLGIIGGLVWWLADRRWA